MNEVLKRLAAAVLAAALTLSMCAVSFADGTTVIGEEPASDEITVIPSNANALLLMDAGAQSPKGSPGKVVTVVLTMAVNREYLPSEKYMLRNITIQPSIPKDSSVSDWPFDIINASYVRHLDDMSYNSTAEVYYKFRISEFATEDVYPLNFTVNATVWREDAVNGTSITEDVTFNLCVWITVIGDGELSGVVTSFGPLQLAGLDDTSGVIDSPVASPGDTVNFKVPVINKGGKLTDVTIAPVVSASLDEFPFVSENINYGRSFSKWSAGDVETLEYTFKISSYATTGNKPVTFKATYYENGTPGECTFQAYIYIKNGYEEIPTTAPSVMVTGYKLLVNGAEVSGLMAGDSAVLRLLLTNNAAYDTVYKNVSTLTLADTKTLTYTVGSSDAAYARSIKAGETAELEYHLTVRNDAEVGPASVGVVTTYETWDSVAGKATQTITIPVSQPMDLVIDEPVVYGAAVAESPTAVSLNIVNMGRAKAINLQITATDGISMAESYYGGDLLAGGSASADIQIKSSKTGEFNGKLIVSYQDANGQAYTQEIILPMNVAEDDTLPAVSHNVEDYDGGSKAGSWPWWAWLLILFVLALIVAAAVLIFLQMKKNRAAETDEAVGFDDIAGNSDGGSGES